MKQKGKKATMKSSPSKKRKHLDRKQSEQLERIILPDAPPRKTPRKRSPERVECRLTPGTPETPPKPKPQSWQGSSKRRLFGSPPGKLLKLTIDESSVDTQSSHGSCDIIAEGPGIHQLNEFASVLELTPATLAMKVEPSTSAEQASSPSWVEVSPAPKASTSKGKALKKKVSFGKAKAETSASTSKGKALKKKKIFGKDVHKVDVKPTDIPGVHKVDVIVTFTDWLGKSESDDEALEEELIGSGAGIDFTQTLPASLPDTVERHIIEWLTNDDIESDKVLTELLPNNLTFDWSKDPDTFVGKREEFTGNPGPTFPINENTTPMDVFLKFFDDDLIDLLVQRTNKHSTYVIDRDMTTEHSRLNKWTNTDRNEMIVFLAILILQGQAPLAEEKDYWRENGYLTLSYFKNLMTYNRFILIKRLLHMSDARSSDEMTADEIRLQKILPVLNHLQRKFSTLYLPSRDIAVDESLLKWLGRLSFSQKIATKAAKVGVKTYELCESATGYLWNFFVYTGKGQTTDDPQTDDPQTDDPQTDDPQTEDPQTDDQQTDLTETNIQGTSLPSPPTKATARIVYNLAKPLLGKGHSIIMDNFYNSPLLARFLKAHGTDCYGTMRINREFLPEAIKSVSKTDLRPGEIVQSYCRDMSVLAWRDNKNIVCMISTFHRGDVGGKEKNGRYRYKPQAVLDYNLAMGGVDKKDQLLAAHPIERSRNKVWYKKVFRRLLNVTISNATVVYRSRSENAKVSCRAFRTRLAEEMVQAHNVVKAIPVSVVSKKPGPGPTRQRVILSGNHYVGTGPHKRALCVACGKARTAYICKSCEVPLCLLVCFELYHTVQDLKTYK